jgi:hypothetical protein
VGGREGAAGAEEESEREEEEEVEKERENSFRLRKEIGSDSSPHLEGDQIISIHQNRNPNRRF